MYLYGLNSYLVAQYLLELGKGLENPLFLDRY